MRVGVRVLGWIDSRCGFGVGWLISLLNTEAVRPEEATVGALWSRSIAGKVDVVRRHLVLSAG